MTLKQMARLGGKARAAKLSEDQRIAIAEKGAKARWPDKAKPDKPAQAKALQPALP